MADEQTTAAIQQLIAGLRDCIRLAEAALMLPKDQPGSAEVERFYSAIHELSLDVHALVGQLRNVPGVAEIVETSRNKNWP